MYYTLYAINRHSARWGVYTFATREKLETHMWDDAHTNVAYIAFEGAKLLDIMERGNHAPYVFSIPTRPEYGFHHSFGGAL